MNNKTGAPLPAEETVKTFPEYSFHDPDFVEWWLGSLYLLSPEDQVAVAEVVINAVNIPEIQTLIAQFVESRMNADRQDQGEPDFTVAPPVLTGSFIEKAMQSARFFTHKAWKENPWLVGIACIGFVFAIGRGIWFVMKEVFRLVF